jgi:hypothetical protein
MVGAGWSDYNTGESYQAEPCCTASPQVSIYGGPDGKKQADGTIEVDLANMIVVLGYQRHFRHLKPVGKMHVLFEEGIDVPSAIDNMITGRLVNADILQQALFRTQALEEGPEGGG